MKRNKINPSLFDGIFESGATYVLLEDRDRDYDAGPIEFLYTIRTLEDVSLAIELLFDILADKYRLEQLLSVKKLDADRLALDFWCYDRESKRLCHFWQYLHRIPTCAEMVHICKTQWEPIHK